MLSNDKNFDICDIIDVIIEEKMKKPFELPYSLTNFLEENTSLITRTILDKKVLVVKIGIRSWLGLAYDLVIELDHFPDISEKDLEYREKLRDAFEEKNTNKAKDLLANENWCIDSNNEIAVKLDKSVQVLNHFIY